MAKNIITRRKLLKDTTLAAIGGTLYFSLPFRMYGMSENSDKTRVVLIRNKDVIDKSNRVNQAIVQEMLDRAVSELTGDADHSEAWKKIIKPDDIVGIKSNVWHYLPTPEELEKAIKKRVLDTGVPEKNISINDRDVKSDTVFQKSTALINVRPVRTHAWSGVGSLIKNYITFAKKLRTYHPDTCADLAELWNLPAVKGKTRLNILVMFTPLFHGVGPHHYNKKYTWQYKGMLAGFDPVAVDSVGVRILLAKRKEYFNEERPLKPPPKHIFLADTRHKLGTASPVKIDLVKIGWEEGMLI